MSKLDLILNWTVKNGSVPQQTKEQLDGIGAAGKKADLGFGQLLGTMAAVTGAVYTAKKAFDFAEEGAQIQQVTDSFDRMNESVFHSPTLLDDMSQAVRGTVGEVDLMRGILTLTAGASDDMAQQFAAAAPKLLEIAKASNKLNPTLGDTAFLYESLSLGIKRNSPLILDNLGIVVKVGEANEKYAAQIGKTVEQLTAEEKSIALLNATLESGQRIIGQVGGNVDSATDSYAQLKVELQETTNTLKQMAAEGLTPLLSGLNSVISGAKSFKAELQGATSQGIVEAKTIEDLEKMADNMQRLSRIDPGAARQQMQEIGVAIARISDNSVAFEKNLVRVLGTAGAIRVAGGDFKAFYREVAQTDALEESKSALDAHLQSIEENKRAIDAAVASFAQAPPTFLEVSRTARESAEAYTRNADAAKGLLQARIDKLAADTQAKADADEAAARAAEQHTVAMQRQAEEMSRLNASTGDLFTTIASGQGIESFIEYGLKAADIAGANALQLAAYTEQAGLADSASQSLAQSLGQAAANLAGQDFTQTGSLDTYLARLQEIQTTVDNFPSLDKIFDLQNRVIPQMQEDRTFRVGQDIPDSIRLLEQVTTTGVTGFGQLQTTAVSSLGVINNAVAGTSSGIEAATTVLGGFVEKINMIPELVQTLVKVDLEVAGQSVGGSGGGTISDAVKSAGVR